MKKFLRKNTILAIRVLATLIAAELTLVATFLTTREKPAIDLIPTIAIAGIDSQANITNPAEAQTEDPSVFIEDDYWERQTGEALSFLEDQSQSITPEGTEGYPPPGEYLEDSEDYLAPPGQPWDEWGGTGGQGGYPPPAENDSAYPAAPTATLDANLAPTETPTPPAASTPTQTLQVGTSITRIPPSLTPVPGQTGSILIAQNIERAPRLDGQSDDPAWQDASPIEIQTQGGVNGSATTVTMKVVHDGERVYFLLSWADPQPSFLYSPWEKQANGSWVRLKSPENMGDDENLFAEDKIALMWPASGGLSEFSTKGCALACHSGENPEAKPYGNKYLPGDDQVADLWVWKTVRNLGQVDDLYLDDTRYSAEDPAAGRQSDPRDGGGYSINEHEDREEPASMPPGGGDRTGFPGFVLNDERERFNDDLFNPGDRLPGIRKSAFEGDRGDISAAWQYRDGRWWLEISRELVTGSEYDVQFDDLSRGFYFGLATFDNTQVRHAVQNGIIELRFEK